MQDAKYFQAPLAHPVKHNERCNWIRARARAELVPRSSGCREGQERSSDRAVQTIERAIRSIDASIYGVVPPDSIEVASCGVGVIKTTHRALSAVPLAIDVRAFLHPLWFLPRKTGHRGRRSRCLPGWRCEGTRLRRHRRPCRRWNRRRSMAGCSSAPDVFRSGTAASNSKRHFAPSTMQRVKKR